MRFSYKGCADFPFELFPEILTKREATKTESGVGLHFTAVNYLTSTAQWSKLQDNIVNQKREKNRRQLSHKFD